MSRAVIVDSGVLEGEPILAISYLPPEDDWDSGFAAFSGSPDSDAETALVCLHCLIEERRSAAAWTSHVVMAKRSANAACGPPHVITCARKLSCPQL